MTRKMWIDIISVNRSRNIAYICLYSFKGSEEASNQEMPLDELERNLGYVLKDGHYDKYISTYVEYKE